MAERVSPGLSLHGDSVDECQEQVRLLEEGILEVMEKIIK